MGIQPMMQLRGRNGCRFRFHFHFRTSARVLGLAAALVVFASALGPCWAAGRPSQGGERVVVRRAGYVPLLNSDSQPIANANEIFRVWTIRKLAQSMVYVRAENAGLEGWLSVDDLIPFNEALVYFTRIINQAPTGWAYASRGAIACELENYDQAINDFTQQIQLEPKSTQAHNARALTWYYLKEYQRAIRDADEAIRLDPRNELAYNNRGLAEFELKSYAQAIADYSRVIELDPDSPLTFNNRGLAWEAQHDSARAIRDFDEAIRLRPQFAMAYRNRGISWYSQKQYERAIGDFDEAIRQRPDFALAFLNRGSAWFAQNALEKAMADDDRAIRLDPSDPWAYNNRGLVWMALKKPDRALADFSEAIRRDPSLLKPHYNRAVAGLAQRKAGAGADALFVVPPARNAGPLASYAMLIAYISARTQDNEREAEEILELADQFDPAEWPGPIVELYREKIPESQALASAANDDQRSEAHCFLGYHSLIQNQPEQAREHFQWVREHGTPALIEYAMALSELDRLDSQQK